MIGFAPIDCEVSRGFYYTICTVSVPSNIKKREKIMFKYILTHIVTNIKYFYSIWDTFYQTWTINQFYIINQIQSV